MLQISDKKEYVVSQKCEICNKKVSTPLQSDFFMLNFRYLAIIMKKDQYFNLEVNLLNDDNIAVMMSELDAAEAIGIYMMLLLHLRTKDDYESSCQPFLLKAFAGVMMWTRKY